MFDQMSAPATGSNPDEPISFDVEWSGNNPESCQKARVVNISGVSSGFSVKINGSIVSDPYEITQGRYGEITVEVIDSNGRFKSTEFANEVTLSADLWIEPNVLVATNTNAAAGQTITGGNDQGGLSSGITATATSNNSGAELTQFLTNEIIRMRRGNSDEPHQVWLDDNQNPVDFSAFTKCSPQIEWSIRTNRSGALENGDKIRVFIEWFDSNGALLLDEMLFSRSANYTDETRTGTEVPPDGATGVKLRVDGWTDIGNEWHQIRLDQGDTWIRVK